MSAETATDHDAEEEEGTASLEEEPYPCTPERPRLPCEIDPVCSPPSATTVRERECELVMIVNYRRSVRGGMNSGCHLRNAAWKMGQLLGQNRASFYSAAIVTPGLDAALHGYLEAFAAELDATLALADRLDSGDYPGAVRARDEVFRAMRAEKQSIEAVADICSPE